MKMKLKVFVMVTLSNLLQNLPTVSSAGLNGITLKLGVYHSPPYDFLIRRSDGNFTASGSNMNTWQCLSQKLNFSIAIVPVIDEDLIAKFGVYETTINKILNKETDGMVAALIVSPERNEKLDFTFMTWAEPYTLIVPKPQEESRLFAFIRPFQPTVWLLMAITVTAFIGIMSWFSWIYNQTNEKKIINVKTKNVAKQNLNKPKLKEHTINNISFYTIYIANIFTNHGMYTPFAQHSFRILAGALLLAALVLVNSYSSIVVSSLTVPVMEQAVNSFKDLATSKRVSLLIRKDFILGQLILDAKTGVFKVLGDQIREHPDRQFLNFPDLYKKLESGPFAYPFMASANRAYVGKQFKNDGFCRFQLSDPLQISSGFYCCLLSKNSTYTKQLSLGFMEIWETGLIYHWNAELTEQGGQVCLDKKKKPKTSVRQVPIKKEDFLGSFLILGIGIGFSLLSFLIELLSEKCSRLDRILKS